MKSLPNNLTWEAQLLPIPGFQVVFAILIWFVSAPETFTFWHSFENPRVELSTVCIEICSSNLHCYGAANIDIL